MQRLPKNDKTLARARRLRRDMSDPERVLWMLLRGRRFGAFKFRRQAPLGDYVVDFVCHERRLVVELDGAHHADPNQSAFDARRTASLESAGYGVVRIWVNALFEDREGVGEAIWNGLMRDA